MISLHSMVSNPYTLLSEIPEWDKYLSVIDLKDAFFPIPLAEESQFLFAFEDPIRPTSQLTLTVLCKGFKWQSSLILIECVTASKKL